MPPLVLMSVMFGSTHQHPSELSSCSKKVWRGVFCLGCRESLGKSGWRSAGASARLKAWCAQHRKMLSCGKLKVAAAREAERSAPRVQPSRRNINRRKLDQLCKISSCTLRRVCLVFACMLLAELKRLLEVKDWIDPKCVF